MYWGCQNSWKRPVKIHIMAFWESTQWSLQSGRFSVSEEEAASMYAVEVTSILIIKAEFCSKSSVTCHTTLCHIPEKNIMNLHHL
jgi:hypothetical protein